MVNLTTQDRKNTFELNPQFKQFKGYAVISSNLVCLLCEIAIFISKYGFGIGNYLDRLEINVKKYNDR